MIVDAHHHLIDPERFHYHFLDFLTDLDRPWLPGDLEPLLVDAGVDATILEQAHDSEAETDFLLDIAAVTPWAIGVVGWLPLVDPTATASSLEHRAGSKLRGVRHLLQDEPDDGWVIQPSVLESLRLLAAQGLTFDVSAFGPRHIGHIPTIAAAVPDLDLVLCHFGFPSVGSGVIDPEWLATFVDAAAVPQCWLKISGLDMTLGFEVDVAAFRPYAELALEHFGPARMIWASNWPVSLRGQGYREALDVWRELIPVADHEAVLGHNALRAYSLPS